MSFGFEILDKQNSTNPNRLGLKFLKVYVDDSLLVDIRFERLDFAVVRHQLAYIDYPERERSKKRFQRSWKKPGNNLPHYKFIRDDGILYINENKHYRVKCVIQDIGGNEAELLFSINGRVGSNHNFDIQCNDEASVFRWDSMCTWAGNYSQVLMDKGALFSDECVFIRESETSLSEFAPRLDIISDEALAGFYRIRLMPIQMSDDIGGMTIAQLGEKGVLNGITTTFSNGWFEGRTRSFGKFVLVRDTLPPEIKPQKIPATGSVTGLKKISFKVTDDICGIADYNAYINGEWILLEYSLKDDEMFYIIDDKMPAGESVFRLVVTDRCGNEAVWEMNLKL